MSWLTPSELFYLTALALVFSGVVLFVLATRYLTGARTNVVRERLRRVTAAPPGTVTANGNGQTRRLLRVTLAPLARLATPQSAEDKGRLHDRLVQAGFRSERSQIIYLGLKVLLALALGGLAVWINTVFSFSFTVAALVILGLMAIGFYSPSLYISSRISDRQAEINHSLPNALDLLVTCVEAGLSLDAAMNRVAGEIGLGAPLLAQEFHQTAMEMQAGLDRGEAFRRMAARTGVDEIRSLAAIIVQTQMFGTSVAKSLRVQAESMRTRRMQIAEERAASVSVKMTVPLIFCIVPSLFVVLIGPGVVRILRVLLPMIGGGS